MKVLVTGGAGFIGSHIARSLANEGATVVCFDNLSTGKRENLEGASSNVSLLVGDVRDPSELQAAMRGCDLVYHEAAVVSVPYSVAHPQETHDVNIQGTLNVLLAARSVGAKRVVFACSAAIYGENPDLPKHEDMAPSPVSPYGVEKITGEYYLGTWARLYGVETVSLRYFNVFGPRQDPKSPYSGVISIFVDRALRGEAPTLFGDGKQTRDFVYVGNVAQANILAGRVAGVSGRAYNVGCGQETSLLELLETIARILNLSLPPNFAPERSGDIRHSVADIRRAQTELGYEAKVGLREGLELLLAHQQNQGGKAP